jgi:hypothetical protein
VTTAKLSLSLCLRLAIGFASSVAGAAPVQAADWNYRLIEQATPTFTADVGLRFWYGRATTAKNLYDNTGALLVSRLTYGDLSIFAAEAYGRFDLDRGWFVKGYVGGGGFRKGNLKDEDFPPVVVPYSATFSIEENGSPIYASADAGFTVLRGGDFRVGVFGGFHYMNETVSAYGCTQTAFNPFICGLFPIPNQVKGITQDNNWYSLRIGVDASVEIDRWKLSVDAAWLPYVWLYGTDAHWLRIGNLPGDFTGPIPEDGTGWGYQLEGFVSYRVTEAFSVGVGGRYWRMQTSGFTHFENHVVGFVAVPQVVEWKTESYGVFFQASLKLGPYPLFSSN